MRSFSLENGKLVEGEGSLTLFELGEETLPPDLPEAVEEWVLENWEHSFSSRAYFESDWFYGFLSIPKKEGQADTEARFFFAFCGERLCVFVRKGSLSPYLSKLLEQKHMYRSVEDLFLTFLEKLMYEDFFLMNSLEEALDSLEEQVVDGEEKGLTQAILSKRKEIAALHSYYGQLSAIGDRMEEGEYFLEQAQLHAFLDKVRRLQEKAQTLLEHCIHIRESLQAETGMRMNRTMQTLTVITTLFMPVTVVSAWYGMNFQHMPELGYPGAYFITVGITVLLTASAIVFCKLKKLF